MTPTEHIQHHQLAIVYWAAQKQGTPFDVQRKHESLGWIDYQFSSDFLPFDPRWQWRRKPKEPRRCWVRWGSDGSRETHQSRKSAEAAIRGYGGECVEMVEVIGEDGK